MRTATHEDDGENRGHRAPFICDAPAGALRAGTCDRTGELKTGFPPDPSPSVATGSDVFAEVASTQLRCDNHQDQPQNRTDRTEGRDPRHGQTDRDGECRAYCAVRSAPSSMHAVPIREDVYAFDGETFVLRANIEDEFLVFVCERSGRLLTRRDVAQWASLPDLAWVRLMTTERRLARLAPESPRSPANSRPTTDVTSE